MSQLTFTSPRATYEETLAFANAVREAGGGNPLDALMPAVPTDSKQCLIAKNLNFNCQVGGLEWQEQTYLGDPETGAGWFMRVFDKETAYRIANAFGLNIFWDGPVTPEQHADLAEWIAEARSDDDPLPDPGAWAIELPQEIGQVAADFDEWDKAIDWRWDEANRTTTPFIDADTSPEALEKLQSFWPYVEASVKEAYANTPFVNDKGELIL